MSLSSPTHRLIAIAMLTALGAPAAASAQSADTTAPRTTLKAPKAVTVGQLKKGFAVRIGCDEACNGRVTLTGRIGIISTASADVAAGGTSRIKLKAAAFQVKELRRGAKLAVTLNATDAAGNHSTRQVKVRLR